MLKIGHGRVEPIRITRWGLLKVLGLVFFGVTLFVFGCDFGSRRDKKMETTNLGDELVVVKTASRPPIDLAIPDRIETATFALG